jgi:hypothetical protein
MFSSCLLRNTCRSGSSRSIRRSSEVSVYSVTARRHWSCMIDRKYGGCYSVTVHVSVHSYSIIVVPNSQSVWKHWTAAHCSGQYQCDQHVAEREGGDNACT